MRSDLISRGGRSNPCLAHIVNAEFRGSAVPEPSSILALSGGLLGLLGLARRRRG